MQDANAPATAQEPVQLNVDITHRRRSTEVFLDFQWKSLVQTVDVTCKGIGFYFLVLLGVIGAIYQAKITGLELQFAITSVVTISIAVSIGCGFLAWGVVQGLYDVQAILRSFNPDVFDEHNLNNYFRRARIAARAAVISCLAVLLVIVGALISLQYR
jgi:hypothetical protein